MTSQPRFGKILDIFVSLALTASILLLLAIVVDLFTPPDGTIGQNPGSATKALTFIGILSIPTLAFAALWPIHLRQKRRGERVNGRVPFYTVASSAWICAVYLALQNL